MKDLLIYLKRRVTEKGREKDISFIYWFTFPNGWARLQPGAWSFFWLFHLDAEVQLLGLSSVAFSDALPGSWIESRVART